MLVAVGGESLLPCRLLVMGLALGKSQFFRLRLSGVGVSLSKMGRFFHGATLASLPSRLVYLRPDYPRRVMFNVLPIS